MCKIERSVFGCFEKMILNEFSVCLEESMMETMGVMKGIFIHDELLPVCIVIAKYRSSQNLGAASDLHLTMRANRMARNMRANQIVNM